MDVTALNLDLILSYAPGMLLTAAFAYGLVAAMRKSSALESSKWFQAILPMLGGIVGAAAAIVAPFFWPPTPVSGRLILGATAGLHMSALFAIVKRFAQLATGELEAKLTSKTGSKPTVEVDHSLSEPTPKVDPAGAPTRPEGEA